MGILNVTPDSFYDGGRFLKPDEATNQARQLADQGADILDLGAESTRPDADPVSEEEEWDRLAPVLGELLENIQIPISIDTTKSGVARRALGRGADIVNDVSGLRGDPKMAGVVKDFEAGVVLMHRRGTPKTMQSLAQYDDVVTEVIDELRQGIEAAESSGISPEQIVVDPGIGFSKTAGQNLEVINRLDEFEQIGRPILIGPSRKSFIGAVIKQEPNQGCKTGIANPKIFSSPPSGERIKVRGTSENNLNIHPHPALSLQWRERGKDYSYGLALPNQRLFGTVAACVLAFERGARIFRVHDVAHVREALLVAEGILRGRHPEATKWPKDPVRDPSSAELRSASSG
ncbi:MAG: dihydropteroate synthase [Omnitrophica bacterium RIFCSPLOWO2_12_FULL_50_11]|nr:MAG: dihydropteroate synthase [Omnitrophica bacterium RIFCSPLOWO2_12_FULL_50_11]